MRKLYKFVKDFGRMGEIEGLFVMDDGVKARLIGRVAYFGAALCKPSDCDCKLSDEDFSVVSIDLDFIRKFAELGLESGFNPIEFIKCDRYDCEFYKKECCFEECRDTVFELHYKNKKIENPIARGVFMARGGQQEYDGQPRPY